MNACSATKIALLIVKSLVLLKAPNWNELPTQRFYIRNFLILFLLHFITPQHVWWGGLSGDAQWLKWFCKAGGLT